MQELAGKPPIATFYTTTKEVVKGKHISTVQTFVSTLEKGIKTTAS